MVYFYNEELFSLERTKPLMQAASWTELKDILSTLQFTKSVDLKK